MNRLLNAIDERVTANELDDQVGAPHRCAPTGVAASPPPGIDFTRGEIRAVVWATNFRPDHSWLQVPVFDSKSRIRHDGGIVDAPGLYVMGLHFTRRRKSSLIGGVGDDARELPSSGSVSHRENSLVPASARACRNVGYSKI